MNNIKRLAQRNGLNTAKANVISESEELIEAIESNDEFNIIDELADIHVTTQQLIELMDIREQVEKRIAYKISRQFKRFGMEEEYESKINN